MRHLAGRYEFKCHIRNIRIAHNKQPVAQQTAEDAVMRWTEKSALISVSASKKET